jgi:hypothetical protein
MTAQNKADFNMVGKRDSGVRVSTCVGIAGGLLAAGACAAQGSNVGAAVLGGVAGAAAGWAAGNVFGTMEEFGTSGTIIGSTLSGLFGANVAIAVTGIVDAYSGVKDL